MAEKKTEVAEPKSGSKKKLFLIIGLIAVVLLAGGGTAAFLMLKKAPESKETQDPAKHIPVPDLNQQADIGPQVNIEEFIVNIISGDTPHYVKASLTVELTNPEVKAEVEKRMPQMRDAILLLIGNKTYEELQDLQGKKQLKAELTSKINSFLKTGKVKAVYLTNFVVQ
ncbi:MAG: flagellar basal body-associated FliL family protein [Proteobacteria bacterium]|nr:flagellar basal body-associated FliL family protein [Pseudomonadota bacterium]